MKSRFFCITTFAVVLSVVSQLVAGTPAENLLKKPDEWYRSNEGRAALEGILSWQTEYGDWPKNTDTTRMRTRSGKIPTGTFDNGATTAEIRVLARAFRINGENRYRSAALKGLDHILKAQYPNGGWPQYYPLSTQYHRHITFNDGTMIKLLELLTDVVSDQDFGFVDPSRRGEAEQAIKLGIECIVKCQIEVDGTPTVWCAQHHAETLEPVLARSYEHPSLSGAESAGILRYLMSLDSPSPDVIRSVKAGAGWFDAAKIEGYRYRKSKSGPALSRDPKAPPLWARFYEIETNRPIFSDRDGIIRYDIQEIGSERRGGYTWYGNWGVNVLKDYAEWPHW
ncbi:Pectic acid lyase [Thalassoglobus neptunius]|uniref:Pectic acid lyase n=1 Tax=Thalassoglobus neptunius TaxID=1938619 RepID=A0A5C5VV24_9PLAN|nr:pectate lyase [Thalassoglobus neptunius]TWT42444.1 Pectic acid lyase [Thalassoglobus neptunius]